MKIKSIKKKKAFSHRPFIKFNDHNKYYTFWSLNIRIYDILLCNINTRVSLYHSRYSYNSFEYCYLSFIHPFIRSFICLLLRPSIRFISIPIYIYQKNHGASHLMKEKTLLKISNHLYCRKHKLNQKKKEKKNKNKTKIKAINFVFYFVQSNFLIFRWRKR